MTHRKYGRDRQRIRRAMARNPGERKPKFERLATAEDSRRMAEAMMDPQPRTTRRPDIKAETALPGPVPPKAGDDAQNPPKPQKRPGFLRRMFQRKTGG